MQPRSVSSVQDVGYLRDVPRPVASQLRSAPSLKVSAAITSTSRNPIKLTVLRSGRSDAKRKLALVAL